MVKAGVIGLYILIYGSLVLTGLDLTLVPVIHLLLVFSMSFTLILVIYIRDEVLRYPISIRLELGSTLICNFILPFMSFKAVGLRGGLLNNPFKLCYSFFLPEIVMNTSDLERVLSSISSECLSADWLVFQTNRNSESESDPEMWCFLSSDRNLLTYVAMIK